jgi:ribosomal protein L29
MIKEEKNSILSQIASFKRDLMMMRVKASSGEAVIVKDFKIKKKEVARLFTKINNKKDQKV